ncbi:MAG TPA: glycosyltransferase [Steroidobacteraceae bacterium]|jgi:glycosyltransferase involved in cell wall biosynthesis|nr:glycosyltransferase [Steroidobacteraceae bacterium]
MPTQRLKVPSFAQAKQAVRVLIASHGHPEFSRGGAEIAAHELFTALRQRHGFESWFLGCSDPAHHHSAAAISQPFSGREYLYNIRDFDLFKLSNRDARFPGAFRSLLRELNPRVVHFHHYVNLGVEAFLHVRETLPNSKIVLTLHEYLALCHHSGQMVTRPHLTLCHESSPLGCTRCFHDLTAADFFMRKLYVSRFFELVDLFVAPSRFLSERYVAWGVPQQRMAVIENLTCGRPERPARAPVSSVDSSVLRVGYFGRISPFKGIGVLMEAAKILQERGAENIVFEIHGDYSSQPAEVQDEFLDRLKTLGRTVKFCGPYDPMRVDELMQSVQLVLMPSIWWENSPIVIQEAMRNRRPVVCSNIGGMAEKVRDSIDGFHFPVGDALALAALLQRLAQSPERLAAMTETMAAPNSTVVERHVELYESLAA